MIRKIGVIIIAFLIALGFGFFVITIAFKQLDSSLWNTYFVALVAVFTTLAGTESVKKYGKSKYYRPELDDAHPEAQRAALEKGCEK